MIVEAYGSQCVVTGVLARPGALTARTGIVTGSIVITPTGESMTHTLFDSATWESITGTTRLSGHTVLVSNGDWNALDTAVVGASYDASRKRWLVNLASNVRLPFRVNYAIILTPNS